MTLSGMCVAWWCEHMCLNGGAILGLCQVAPRSLWGVPAPRDLFGWGVPTQAQEEGKSVWGWEAKTLCLTSQLLRDQKYGRPPMSLSSLV